MLLLLLLLLYICCSLWAPSIFLLLGGDCLCLGPALWGSRLGVWLALSATYNIKNDLRPPPYEYLEDFSQFLMMMMAAGRGTKLPAPSESW